jgi:hypothetical protein
MKWFVYLLGVVLFVLHQDFWNFDTPYPLVFDFLPITAAYHAGFSIACMVFMALMVKFAWPKHLEAYEQLPPQPGAGEGH